VVVGAVIYSTKVTTLDRGQVLHSSQPQTGSSNQTCWRMDHWTEVVQRWFAAVGLGYSLWEDFGVSMGRTYTCMERALVVACLWTPVGVAEELEVAYTLVGQSPWEVAMDNRSVWTLPVTLTKKWHQVAVAEGVEALEEHVEQPVQIPILPPLLNVHQAILVPCSLR